MSQATLEVTAGEAEQGMDGGEVVLFRVGFVGPGLGVLPLDRYAGGVAEVVVVVVEVWPDGFHSLGVGIAVKGFQHMACLAGLGVRARGIPLGEGGVGFSLVGHAVKRGLSTASTDAKVHVAVRAYVYVGQGERSLGVGDELALFTNVG